MTIAAEQAKERGNKQFAAGNYQDAISCYDEAISIVMKMKSKDEKNEPSKLHIYYSNRSAAHLSFNEFDRALVDAESCIKEKHDWCKGYSRKGAALHRLKRFKEALAAYTEGLTFEPTNVACLKGQKEIIMAQKSTNATSSRTFQPNLTSTWKDFCWKTNSARIQTFQFALRLMMLINAVLYVIPFRPRGYYIATFTNFFRFALLNQLVYLTWTHGRPRLTHAYGAQLVQDPSLHLFAFGLFFWMGKPYALSFVPIVLIDLPHVCWYIGSICHRIQSPLYQIGASVLDRVFALVVSDPTWQTRSSSEKWNLVTQTAPRQSAHVMVLIGIMMLFEWITPMRQILRTIVYWQYLRLLYALRTPAIHASFRALHAQMNGLVHHPKCPRFFTRMYVKGTTILHNQARMPTREEMAQASRPKCNIM